MNPNTHAANKVLNETREPHIDSLQYVMYVTHSDVRIFYSPPVVYAHTKCRKYEIRAHPSPHTGGTGIMYVLCKGLYQLTLHIKARGCCHWHKPFKCGWPAEYLVKVGKHPSCHSQKKCLFRHFSPSNSIPPSPLRGDTLFYHTFLLYTLVEPSLDQTRVIGTQPCTSPCQRGVSVCCRDSVDGNAMCWDI